MGIYAFVNTIKIAFPRFFRLYYLFFCVNNGRFLEKFWCLKFIFTKKQANKRSNTKIFPRIALRKKA
jgi:hypothetical protein